VRAPAADYALVREWTSQLHSQKWLWPIGLALLGFLVVLGFDAHYDRSIAQAIPRALVAHELRVAALEAELAAGRAALPAAQNALEEATPADANARLQARLATAHRLARLLLEGGYHPSGSLIPATSPDSRAVLERAAARARTAAGGATSPEELARHLAALQRSTETIAAQDELDLAALHRARRGVDLVSLLLLPLVLLASGIQLWRLAARVRAAQTGLTDSEQRLRQMVTDMPVMVDAFDERGHICFWNRECERVTGYGAEEIVGNPEALRLLIPDDDYRESLLAEWQRRGHNYRHWDWRMRCKDGSERIISWSNVSAISPAPGWASWGIGIDVTHQRRAEARLRDSSQFLQTLLDTIPTPIFYKDVHGAYRGCNHAFAEEIVGRRPDEIVGATLFELDGAIPEDLARLYHEKDLALMRTRRQQTYQAAVRCQDGQRRTFVFYKTPYYDPGGNLVGLVGVMLDVSELETTLAALRHSETRYAELVANLKRGVIVFEPDATQGWRVSQINKAATHLLALDETDGDGRDVLTAFKHKAGIDIPPLVRDVAAQNAAKQIPIERREQMSITLWWSAYAYPLPSGEVVFTFDDETAQRRSEQELQASEARLRTIFETVPDWVFLKDRDRRYTQVNPAMADSLNRSMADLVGARDAELFGPAHEEFSADVDRRALDGETVRAEFTRAIRGQECTFDVIVTPLHSRTGKVIGICGSARDITERKRADQRLRETTTRFRLVSDVSADLIYEWDIISDRLEWFGDIDGALGYEPGTIERSIEAWVGLIHPQDQARLAGMVERHRIATEPIETEYRVRHRDGSWRHWTDRAKPILDAEGRPCRWIGGCSDVTAERCAAAALTTSEARFRTITEQARDIIMVLGADSSIQYVSPAVERVCGFAPDELKGWRGIDFIHADDRGRLMGILTQAVEQPRQAIPVGHFRVRRRDEGWVDLEGTITSLIDEPGIAGVVVSAHDIGERLEAETALRRAQKMKAVGTLAGGIAHDFNNILYAILGYGELARDGLPDVSPARENIEQVIQAGRRATELVKHLLTFTRQQEHDREPLRVAPIVEETLRLLRGSLPATVAIKAQFATRAEVLADAAQIQQVVMNLCTNAYQALGEGGGTLRVELDEVARDHHPARPQHPQPQRLVRLRVSDNGCGMDPATIERIFEPYFSTKQPGEGTGLGLAIVHGVVESYGGWIEVESESGKGTTFSVFLPVFAGKTLRRPAVEPAQQLRAAGERILFVDDESMLVRLAQRGLNGLGFAVTAVTDSRTALELLRASPRDFDLLLTDQTMPHLTGLELAAEAQRLRSDLPIVLCTGYSEHVNEARALRHGISAFVPKPIELDALARIILEVLQRPEGETQCRAS